ncbi:MAG: hypothetical protein WCL18_06995 [bacterium]
MIGFEKKGIRIIQDGTQRALAITQMIMHGERVPTKIYWYVHNIEDNQSYPYIDYYPEKE